MRDGIGVDGEGGQVLALHDGEPALRGREMLAIVAGVQLTAEANVPPGRRPEWRMFPCGPLDDRQVERRPYVRDGESGALQLLEQCRCE